MGTDLFKNFLRYALVQSFYHIWWVIPLSIIIYTNNATLFGIFFLLSILSLLFASWRYENKVNTTGRSATKIRFSETPVIIRYGHPVIITMFLALTLYSTYMGMADILGLEAGAEVWFVRLFSFTIVMAIGLIVIKITSRRKPGIIVLLTLIYVLADGLIALPFNYNFFYKYFSSNERINVRSRLIKELVPLCKLCAESKLQYATDGFAIYGAKISQMEKNSLIFKTDGDTSSVKILAKARAELLTGAVHINDLSALAIDSTKWSKIINKLDLCRMRFDSIKLTNSAIRKDKICEDLADSLNMISTALLDTTHKHNQLTDNIKRKKQSKLRTIKKTLVKENRKNESLEKNDALLVLIRSKSDTLRSYKETPALESIAALYKYAGNSIKGKNTGKNELSLISIMSLSISIVIDILPLLLSLLYAWYRRTD